MEKWFLLIACMGECIAEPVRAVCTLQEQVLAEFEIPYLLMVVTRSGQDSF